MEKQINGLFYELDEKSQTATVVKDVFGTDYPELDAVVIPNSVICDNVNYLVTSIGNEAFSNHSGITKLSIPNSVTSIGCEAFAYCGGLTSVTIPDSVTTIENYAFSDCSILSNITIPDSVTSIGAWAFWGCAATSITIPKSVTSIGKGALTGCSNLIDINVDEDNTAYSSVNGVLCDKNKDTLICCPAGRTEIADIPNMVKKIGDYAFSMCNKLTSVVIPDSVTTIGECAFEECWELKSVTIPKTVTSLGRKTFINCARLSDIIIILKNNTISIGEGTFSSCGRFNLRFEN